MALESLVDELLPEGSLRAAIDGLLDWKRSSSEAKHGARIPEIGDFLEAELARMTSAHPDLPATKVEEGHLDDFFRSVLS